MWVWSGALDSAPLRWKKEGGQRSFSATLWGFIRPRLGFLETGSTFLQYRQHNVAPRISALSADPLLSRQSQCGHHSWTVVLSEGDSLAPPGTCAQCQQTFLVVSSATGISRIWEFLWRTDHPPQPGMIWTEGQFLRVEKLCPRGWNEN